MESRNQRMMKLKPKCAGTKESKSGKYMYMQRKGPDAMTCDKGRARKGKSLSCRKKSKWESAAPLYQHWSFSSLLV